MRRFFVVVGCCVLFQTAAGGDGRGETIPDPHPKSFIRNAGQWPAEVRYGLLGAGAKAALTRDGIDIFARAPLLQIPSEILDSPVHQATSALAHTRLRFVRPSPRMRIVEGAEAVTRMQFYHGRDRSEWHEDVGTVQSVTYENVWEHIDIEYRYDGERLRQRIHVRDGGDPRDIAFVVEGADSPAGILRATGTTSASGRDMPMEIRTDTLRPRPGPDLVTWRQLAETEFCTYFGGRGIDYAWDIEVDRASNMYLFMLSESSDLPVANELRAWLDGKNDHYLAGLSCDGDTLLFGTYFGCYGNELGSPAMGQIDFGMGYRTHMRQAGDGDLLLITEAYHESFPLTAGAVQTELQHQRGLIPDYNDVLLRFTNRGRLRGSTLFEGPTYADIIDFGTGPDGDVFVLGHAHGEQWFVTPDVIHPSIGYKGNQLWPTIYTTSYLARLSPTLDAVRWGSYFFHSGGDNNRAYYMVVPGQNWADSLRFRAPVFAMDMEIDRRGDIVITGSADTVKRLPIRTSFGKVTPMKSFAWVVKIAGDGRSYRYATALHAEESAWGSALVLDTEGNAFIAGTTGEAGFPSTAPKLITTASTDERKFYLARIDTGGNLERAVLTGFPQQSLHYYERMDITLSRCAEIVLGAISLPRQEGEIRPRDGDPWKASNAPSLWLPTFLVCDSAMQRVSYAATGYVDESDRYQPGFYHNSLWIWSQDWMQFDPSGYLYGTEHYSGGQTHLPVTYNTSRTDEEAQDIVFSRHHYPLCQLLTCSLQVIDSLTVPDTGEPIVPSAFSIQVTVSTQGADANARLVTGDLFLPAGIQTVDGDSVVHLVFEPDLMRPGTDITRSVMVRATRAFQTDTLPYVFIGYYTDTREESACLRPLTVCTETTRLHRIAEYRPLPECELVVHAQQMQYPADPPCAPGTVPVQLTLRHRGEASWQLGDVALIFAEGMGLRLASPGDSLRGNCELRPGSTLSWTWDVVLPRVEQLRRVRVSAVVRESTGAALLRCDGIIDVPAMAERHCELSLPTRAIIWDVAAQRALTDPVIATVRVSSSLDSTVGPLTARLDLSRAPHLQLDASDSFEKSAGTLGPCAARDITWTLHALEPAGEYESDTVTVRYTFANDPATYSCTQHLQLARLDQSVQCDLQFPDTLAPRAGDPTRLDTLVITATLRNAGTATANLRDAEVTLRGVPAFTAIDPLQVPLSALARGASTQLRFRILIPGSAYARAIGIQLTARNQQGSLAAQCADSVFLPPLASHPACTVLAPARIRIDSVSGQHVPDVFSLSAVVRNQSDTTAGSVTATVDLADSPFLRLATGEQPGRTIAALAGRDSVRVSWQLEVAGMPTADSVQQIRVLLLRQNPVLSAECSAPVLLEGTPPVVRLQCFSFGHDSAFADSHYEKIVPDPLQVLYALVNTGTTPARDCSVRLNLPAGWQVVGDRNPVSYGEIAPGDTVTRSWLITPEGSYQWTPEITLTWDATCDDVIIDSACTHRISVDAPGTWDIVLTPRWFVFTAEQNGSLPPPQQAQLWTKQGAALPWQVRGGAHWLDMQPLADQGAGTISLQPLTTALAPGLHRTSLEVASTLNNPRQLQVVYEITDGTTEVTFPLPADAAMSVYPNPQSPRQGNALLVQLPAALRDASSLEVALVDILGRTIFRDMQVPPAGTAGVISIEIPPNLRRPQVVILSIRGGHVMEKAAVLLSE